MEFTTRRLEIKKVIPEYIPIMFKIWDRENEVGKYIPEYDPNWDVDAFKEHIINTFRSDLYERGVIKLKDSNEIIGYVSVYREDSRSKSVNIYIAKEYWNHGYGHEVLSSIVKRLKKEGKNEMPLDMLIDLYDAHGIPPETVVEMAGDDFIKS